MADTTSADYASGYDDGYNDGYTGSAFGTSTPLGAADSSDYQAGYTAGYSDGGTDAAAVAAGQSAGPALGQTQDGTPAIVTAQKVAAGLVTVLDAVGNVLGYGRPASTMPKVISNHVPAAQSNAGTIMLVVGGVALAAYLASRHGKA